MFNTQEQTNITRISWNGICGFSIDRGSHCTCAKWQSRGCMRDMRRQYLLIYKIITFEFIILKFFWLHNFTEEKPYKVEVFEDNLYVSTYQTNNIIKLNKFGYGDLIYLMRGLNRASDILIVQENKQTKNSKFLSMSLFTGS